MRIVIAAAVSVFVLAGAAHAQYYSAPYGYATPYVQPPIYDYGRENYFRRLHEEREEEARREHWEHERFEHRRFGHEHHGDDREFDR